MNNCLYCNTNLEKTVTKEGEILSLVFLFIFATNVIQSIHMTMIN
jgi:hypothetical protein